MIELAYDNRVIPFGNYIHHHVARPDAYSPYVLQISTDETGTIREIEQYAGVPIADPRLLMQVLAKDTQKRSMGLLWILKNQWHRRPDSMDSTSPFPILYNIQSISIKPDALIIAGQASTDNGSK